MWEKFIELSSKYPLDTLSHAASLLPVLIGLTFLNQLRPAARLMVLLVGLFFLKDSVALYHSLRSESNLYLYNLQSFVEIGVVGAAYAVVSPVSIKKVIISSAIACLVVNVIFYSSLELSPGNLTVARLFMLAVVLMYLTRITNQVIVRNIMTHDLFWFSAGLLVYIAGTFFIFLFGHYLFEETTSLDTFNLYWNIQQVIYIIFCVISAVGLWMSRFERVKPLPAL
ncbi:hypothetical protein BN8_00310 [Fibrisoma limi BUZ 3]|uniref:Uncharacterized protein n=1 Tax=Fibrisoma limi BUZ 3 TaxID=1185876 RepID=I2GBW6_9BACT|nr:hypothetical protein [Fibrisoma limi]CCH51390.1 hypothetical protein BN8_00310 [Fibrisoma limi BUZ 3]